MARRLSRDAWRGRVARLRRETLRGNIGAAGELGLLLQQGMQDERGRTVVRRNAGRSFPLLARAAAAGDMSSVFPLAYAFDVGLGTRRDKRRAIRLYRRAWQQGSSAAASNIATVHRDRSNLRLAFKWWSRAAAVGDGEAAVDVGYCYQYGIGTRRNARLACEMYKRAIASTSTTDCGREEAMYHLAVAYLDAGDSKRARALLLRAAADADFPEAESVLNQLEAKRAIVPCRCRRGLLKSLPGHAACPQHRTASLPNPRLQRTALRAAAEPPGR